MTLETVVAGGWVYEQGDVVDSFYILLSGEAAVIEQDSPHAPERQVTLIVQLAHTGAHCFLSLIYPHQLASTLSPAGQSSPSLQQAKNAAHSSKWALPPLRRAPCVFHLSLVVIITHSLALPPTCSLFVHPITDAQFILTCLSSPSCYSLLSSRHHFTHASLGSTQPSFSSSVSTVFSRVPMGHDTTLLDQLTTLLVSTHHHTIPTHHHTAHVSLSTRHHTTHVSLLAVILLSHLFPPSYYSLVSIHYHSTHLSVLTIVILSCLYYPFFSYH